MTTLKSERRTFRSVDEWKTALMALPENNFFELLRSVLGNIKTPFSKQRLLDDLFNFLSRDEIRKTIAAYLNEQDQKIIAAVALLKEPVPEDLEAFFAGDFDSAELRAFIINLEERLILYRFREKNILRLALNPVLEQVFSPFITDTRLLFSSYENDTNTQVKEAGTFVHDSRIMAALFAFIQSEEELLKTETGTEFNETPQNGILFNGIRKKVLDEGKKIFPTLDLELAVKTLIRLELFRQEGRSLVVCGEKVKDYCYLSAAERQEYWIAGLYLCLNESDSDAHNGGLKEEIYGSCFSWNRLRRIASFIHRFMALLAPGRVYPEITLRRFQELLEREDRENTWASPFFDGGLLLPFEGLLSLTEKTGLLQKTSNSEKNETCWKVSGITATVETAVLEDVQAKPVIVMDAAFSFILYPEISFADALMLAKFCSIKENNGASVCFELTRQSVVRGFDQGIKADAMMDLLGRLSLNRLDANLDWTLKEWESRYAEVSLHQGIILSLAEDRRYLAKAGPVSRMIEKTLAPGVYLLSSEEKSEAAKTLLKAGVDIVAQPPSASATGFSRNFFSRLGSPEITEPHTVPSPTGSNQEAPSKKNDAEEKTDSTDFIKQKFRETLEKMKLTKPERDELLARIERRLVLTEAQLEGTSLRYEKLEARGLDYAGKTAIAKQAMETGSLLDVSWPAKGGELNRTTGIAQALEKKEGENILVLRTGGASENNAKVFRIPLGKISLLRRIKQSLFGE